MHCDVVVIGAGPAGAVAAALLAQSGLSVIVLEREHFPRFSIGESLLPQSMEYLQQAGMLQAVVEAGFQHKNGARFVRGDATMAFDFHDKFTPGWCTTYQVERAHFDHILAQCAQNQGADIRYGCTVTEVTPDPHAPRLAVRDEEGAVFRVQARHIFDASGFGRVLQRLLKLETPSGFPGRAALFTHVQDHIAAHAALDRNKITVAIHPKQPDIWYWLIPFANGRCSIGVVGPLDLIQQTAHDAGTRLRECVAAEPHLATLLQAARWDTPVRSLVNYSANVQSLVGPGFTLLGNAGEFLDPVFSSGVTIALKSASMAAGLLTRQLRGAAVDWHREFETPLRRGIDTFRCFVEMWYTGALQNIFFHPQHLAEVRRMICAILAGYAWDENNPYVTQTRRRMATLEALCSARP